MIRNGISTSTSGKICTSTSSETVFVQTPLVTTKQCISKRNGICTSTSGKLVSSQYQMKNQVTIRAKLGIYIYIYIYIYLFSSLFYRCISFLSKMTTMNAGLMTTNLTMIIISFTIDVNDNDKIKKGER